MRQKSYYDYKLFVSHRLGRTDMRHKITWCDKHKYAYHKSHNIEHREGNQIYFYRSLADVVCSRVKAYNARKFLKTDDEHGKQVAKQDATAYDENSKPEKRMAYGRVARSKGFECAYHLCTLKNDDKKTGYHGETRYTYHQHKNDPHVDVEQRQPRENLRISLIDSLRSKDVAIFVGIAVHLFHHVLCRGFQCIEVLDCEFCTRALSRLPIVYF